MNCTEHCTENCGTLIENIDDSSEGENRRSYSCPALSDHHDAISVGEVNALERSGSCPLLDSTASEPKSEALPSSVSISTRSLRRHSEGLQQCHTLYTRLLDMHGRGVGSDMTKKWYAETVDASRKRFVDNILTAERLQERIGKYVSRRSREEHRNRRRLKRYEEFLRHEVKVIRTALNSAESAAVEQRQRVRDTEADENVLKRREDIVAVSLQYHIVHCHSVC